MTLTFRFPVGVTVAVALALALSGAPSPAQTDLSRSSRSFNLVSDSHSVRHFSIEEPSGAMSRNWMDSILHSGSSLTLQFRDPDDQRCRIRTRVGFTANVCVIGVVNYCGTTSIRVTSDCLIYERDGTQFETGFCTYNRPPRGLSGSRRLLITPPSGTR